jgi:hypothetical protein
LNLIPIGVLAGGQAIGALDKSERIILCAAAVLLSALFGQPLLLLVAAGAGYRIFTKDLPAEPSHSATVYYLVVLAALGFVSTLAPMPLAGSHQGSQSAGNAHRQITEPTDEWRSYARGLAHHFDLLEAR